MKSGNNAKGKVNFRPFKQSHPKLVPTFYEAFVLYFDPVSDKSKKKFTLELFKVSNKKKR